VVSGGASARANGMTSRLEASVSQCDVRMVSVSSTKIMLIYPAGRISISN
jgi:hypothetical protein